MFQQGLAAAEARLAAGDWVHIFPEGTRSRDGRMGPVRKGVGRLVASCADAAPLIVPFVHSGMQEVLPKGSLLPKANKEVRDWDTCRAEAEAAGWAWHAAAVQGGVTLAEQKEQKEQKEQGGRGCGRGSWGASEHKGWGMPLTLPYCCVWSPFFTLPSGQGAGGRAD
jgi:hypothetical protein